jgi:mono/diheme cytochrome c family protein
MDMRIPPAAPWRFLFSDACLGTRWLVGRFSAAISRGLSPIPRPVFSARAAASPIGFQFAATLLSVAAFTLPAGAAPGRIGFNDQIRPILSNACFQCHGPDEKKREADLRLDTFEGATRDLGGYKAVLPGKPDQSALIERMISHDKEEVMPPPKSKKPRATEAQIRLLKQWISEGAAYEGHWSFQPVRKVQPPAVRSETSVRNPVDRFILAKLEALGIAPSAEADKSTLLRRVHLDLTGLPPTPEERETFLRDNSSDAYEKVVERLLASPHYGERWARHWLDQARYADSDGYSIDGARAMWPYRDWVIRALNEDKPFDQFTLEQIAGDLLPGATRSQKIASAFHRNTMINAEGGSDPEQFRNESVVDRVNTTGAVWLGLTLGCAQCHTHKYDPISHQEYFRLFAFFNSSTDVNNVGETLRVVPGEIFPAPKAKVSPEQYAAALKKVVQTQAAAPKRRAEWLKKLETTTEPARWHGPKAASVTTRSGRQPRILEDGAVVVPAAGAPQDVVEIHFTPDHSTAAAFRVRLLPAPSFNAQYAGTAKDGSFALTEVELTVDGNAQPLAWALTDLNDPKNPVANAIDHDPQTAWQLDPKRPESKGAHEAWFFLKEPIAVKGKRWVIRLRHESGKGQLIGKFAVELTEKPPLLPPETKVAEEAWKLSRQTNPGTSPNHPAFVAAFKKLDEPQVIADAELARLTAAAQPAQLLIMKDLPMARPTLLHLRGDFLNPDKALGPLQPDTPAVLPPMAPSDQPRTRLDLARWLVAPENPLTPRVTVNRIWMRYFGKGLVETENDFGTQGTAPTHPELLDWLANELVSGGWSLKKLHRTLVTSATYRQSSMARKDLQEIDPLNLWLARQNRIRLDAEIIRDSALASSNLLDPTLGGPPVFPPQPEGVFAFTQAAKPWVTSTGGSRFRRALYTQFYRSAQHPLTSTFDAPNFSTTCTRRLSSNTPLQALMTANDEAFMEMAQAAAQNLWKRLPGGASAEDAARIRLGFLSFLSRPPSQKELQRSQTFLDARRKALAATPSDAAQIAGTSAAPGPVEWAAWTEFSRALINTDERITRE